MFALSGAAGGGAQALEEILKQEFIKAIERQQMAQRQQTIDQQGARDAGAMELGRGRLANDSRQIDLGGRKLDLDASQFDQQFGEGKRRFDAEAPDREADRSYKGALTGELKRKPQAEVDERSFTSGRDRTLHGYRLGEIGASAAANPRQDRVVQVEGPDGRPMWVRESDAVGKPAAQAARAVTGSERSVLAFYNRAKDAEGTISAPDQSGVTLEDKVAKGGLRTQLGLQYAPNIMQSSDQQAYRQAQRAFTEARLRKESGAAIPTSEYENDAKTYFAQPGDAPETIEQKRQKRQTVLEGLKFASGRAYDEFYGERGGAKPAQADPLGLFKK
jgi:hypothetical protein